MIAGLKPYPVYCDSGLVWLDRVPAHWSTRRMKFLVRERRQRGFPREPLLAATQTKGVVRKQDYEARTVTATAGLENLQLVEVGDFVISLRSFQGGIEISHARGIISPAYTILTAHSSESRDYLRHLFKSAVFIQSLRLFVTGIREGQTIDYERLGRAVMPLPPPEEQTAIGRFLDHVGGRIDRAIRAKRKVIALLQEQKEAIIHCAVTRGVDGASSSMPVELSSIGSVPDSWSIEPFVRCAVERADYRGATPDKVASGVFLVTARNIKKGWIDYECSREFVRASDYAQIMRRGLPKIGDILITTEAPLGHVACVDREDVAIAQRVIRFRLAPDRMLSGFAVLCLNDRYVQDQLAERATGSTAQGIKASKLPQLMVVVPTIAEQGRIVDVVRRKTEPLNRIIASKAREIEMLGEFRIRLIADVVTGKLDVRGAAANLPDVAAESGAMKPDSADDSIDEEAVVE